MKTPKSRRTVAGLTLIGIGLGLYALQRVEGLGESAIFLLIGAVFLAAYLYRRVFGFLIPACLLLGLGTGPLLERSLFRRIDGETLGLGIGFVAIWLIALVYERKSQWWPLIPGAFLIIAALPRGDDVFDLLVDHWPLILVVVGALILLGIIGKKQESTSD